MAGQVKDADGSVDRHPRPARSRLPILFQVGCSDRLIPPRRRGDSAGELNRSYRPRRTDIPGPIVTGERPNPSLLPNRLSLREYFWDVVHKLLYYVLLNVVRVGLRDVVLVVVH